MLSLPSPRMSSFTPAQMLLLMARLFFQRNAGVITIAGFLVTGNIILAGFLSLFGLSFWLCFWLGLTWDVVSMLRRAKSLRR